MGPTGLTPVFPGGLPFSPPRGSFLRPPFSPLLGAHAPPPPGAPGEGFPPLFWVWDPPFFPYSGGVFSLCPGGFPPRRAYYPRFYAFPGPPFPPPGPGFFPHRGPPFSAGGAFCPTRGRPPPPFFVAPGAVITPNRQPFHGGFIPFFTKRHGSSTKTPLPWSGPRSTPDGHHALSGPGFRGPRGVFFLPTASSPFPPCPHLVPHRGANPFSSFGGDFIFFRPQTLFPLSPKICFSPTRGFFEPPTSRMRCRFFYYNKWLPLPGFHWGIFNTYLQRNDFSTQEVGVFDSCCFSPNNQNWGF